MPFIGKGIRYLKQDWRVEGMVRFKKEIHHSYQDVRSCCACCYNNQYLACAVTNEDMMIAIGRRRFEDTKLETHLS